MNTQTRFMRKTKEYQAKLIQDAVYQFNGNESKAARFLGCNRNTLRMIRKKYSNPILLSKGELVHE